MGRKLQVVLSDEAWTELSQITKSANDGFRNGSIAFSDVVNEMILNSKVDIKSLQARHTNLRKSLRLLAAEKDLDIDIAIKALTELKTRGGKKQSKTQISFEGVAE